MTDSKGVISNSRSDLNNLKKEFAIATSLTTLSQAITNADVFIGVSRGNLLTDTDLETMADNPIIFALANPTPEVEYSHALKIRPDAVIATGRTDRPNQINNSLIFPYLFRGAMDTLSTTINTQMLLAAVKAIARIAREPADKEIEKKYGKKFTFGMEYLLPKMGDKRLLTEVSSAVAQAAMDSGVARRGIASFSEYRNGLLSRVDNSNFFNCERIRHRSTTRNHSGCEERKCNM